MKCPVFGISADVWVLGDRLPLEEYDTVSSQEIVDRSSTPIPVYRCVIPVVSNKEFKVVVSAKSTQVTKPTNAVLYIDGQVAASKYKIPSNGAMKMVLDQVRVSSRTVRPFIFRKIEYTNSNEARALDRDLGTLRVDVWIGWVADNSYDHILNYTEIGEERLEAGRSRIRPPDEKIGGDLLVDHTVEYGPGKYVVDKRRHFEKQGRLCRFVFAYRDLMQIKLTGLYTQKMKEIARTRQKKFEQLRQQGPISISDSDADD